MSLVFLIILSLVIVYGVRGTMIGEQVAKNLQSSETATQAAETALRYCENELLNSGFALTLPASDPPHWKTAANWQNDEKSLAIPAEQLAATGMRSLPAAPRCMVERLDLPPGPAWDPQVPVPEAYLITAVGYSADYEASSNKGISGSEMWLQSILVH